MDVSTNPIVMN